MSKTLKCNSLWSMISHRPQHQYIFFRASKVLNDNCFAKGGGYSHPCNKTCFGVNGVSSIRLFPQTCKQQPAVCSPQSFKVNTNTKQKCLYCHSVPSVKRESSFSLQAMTVLLKPKSGGQDGMKVALQCHRWYLSSHQVAGGASWPASWDPAQAGSLELQNNYHSRPSSSSPGVNPDTRFAYVKCHQATISFLKSYN